LALMGQDSGFVPRDELQRTAFLRAVLASWPLYLREGARYARIMQYPQPLWSLPTLLKVELAKRGVETAKLMSPLPNDDLRAFLVQHGDMFSDVLAESETA
jgi:hypothetical protein